MERLDLAELLADFDGAPPPAAPLPSVGKPAAGDTIYLGPLVRNLTVTGPPGPPPSWVITDPPHAGQWTAEQILTGIGAPLGQPPPTLELDDAGMFYRDEDGQRVDVRTPDRCMQCQRYMPKVTIIRGQPILCTECRDSRNRHA